METSLSSSSDSDYSYPVNYKQTQISDLLERSKNIRKSIDDRLRKDIVKEKEYNNIIKKRVFEGLERILKFYTDAEFCITFKYQRNGKKTWVTFSIVGNHAAIEFDRKKLLKWGRPYDLIKEWILEYLKEIPSMTLVESKSEKKRRYPIMKIVLDEFYFKEMELAIEKEMIKHTQSIEHRVVQHCVVQHCVVQQDDE